MMATRGGCLKMIGGGAVLGGLLLGGVWVQRDAFLAGALEDQLQAATGVEADIQRLETRPFEGEVSLQVLTLNNPPEEGYSSPYVLKIERIELSLEPSTLLQDTVLIRSLTVSGIEVNLEQQLAKNNVAGLARQLQKATQSETPSSKAGKRVKIEQLTLKDIDASFKVAIIGGFGAKQTLEIGDIQVQNIDSYNPDGKVLEMLTQAITGAILKELTGPLELGQ